MKIGDYGYYPYHELLYSKYTGLYLLKLFEKEKFIRFWTTVYINICCIVVIGATYVINKYNITISVFVLLEKPSLEVSPTTTASFTYLQFPNQVHFLSTMPKLVFPVLLFHFNRKKSFPPLTLQFDL